MGTYKIDFAASVEKHLKALKAADRQRVLGAIARSLMHEPARMARNRKPMRPNPLAPWELRVGDFRVYYRVIETPAKVVEVAAVGEKRGNQLWIAGEQVQL